MKILIDADGCPVVNQTVMIARQYEIEVRILCDTAHDIQKAGVTTFVFSKGADSVDFALVNMLCAGDLVITQDYGLAALCLAKNANAMNQDGFLYTSENIDALLLSRHTAKKIRNAGGRVKGAKKRTRQQDLNFQQALIHFLTGVLS